MTKVIRYTLKDTTDYVLSCNEHPNIIVLHSLTNDLKTMEPQVCVQNLEHLILEVKQKWNDVTILVSLTTPRSDDLLHQTNGQIINALIKQRFSDNEMILYCDHSNMLKNGNPNADYLSEDKYYISAKGISMLAANLKKSIHTVLNIPDQDSGRFRSRFRSSNRRGRGRGYPMK